MVRSLKTSHKCSRGRLSCEHVKPQEEPEVEEVPEEEDVVEIIEVEDDDDEEEDEEDAAQGDGQPLLPPQEDPAMGNVLPSAI